MGVSEFGISMGESAIGCKFAVTGIKKLAFNRFIVTVGLTIKELLLLADLVHVHVR